ncbi:MAG: hypothetical protein CMF38_01295 [Legionellaceae bacterium]|nr:hypothetical protein [Legionellaceae bacterium]HAF88144.1 hypothetical protein [Legionellales bacterium]HCA88837.1 hypothetical protein [Legionellales bacterium]
MNDYIYRGFKVQYNIHTLKKDLGLYKADGVIAGLANHANASSAIKKFHTESSTIQEAEVQIKKLVEDYIDFEWTEFNKMQEEK